MEVADQHPWYAEVQAQALGPLTLDQVEELIRRQDLRAYSLVWNASMTDWRALETTPLADLYLTIKPEEFHATSTEGVEAAVKTRDDSRKSTFLVLIMLGVLPIVFFGTFIDATMVILGIVFSLHALERAQSHRENVRTSGGQKLPRSGIVVAIIGLVVFGGCGVGGLVIKTFFA